MPHGSHIYAKSSDMAKAKMCAYPQTYHASTHWKRALQCLTKCPCINLPDQETGYQYSKETPPICFHIYHMIVLFTAHGNLTLNDKQIFACVNRILL